MSAIFPIIRIGRAGTLEEIVGTGFLVSEDGHFFSCSHVIGPGTRVAYSAAIEPADLKIRASFDLIHRDIRKDIFFGKLSVHRGMPLSFAGRSPKLGSQFDLLGFECQMIRSPNGQIIVRSMPDAGKLKATCIAVVDGCTIPEETYDNTTFPARKLSAVISRGSALGGYSGSPVIGTDGRIVAMHSGSGSHPTLNNGNPFMVQVSAKELRAVFRKRHRYKLIASYT